MLVLLLVLLFAASVSQPAPPGPEPDPPTWADKLEAWSTLGAAFVALAAAVATIWLLVHQIREANRAKAEAADERAGAAEDRELARRDREYMAAERRDTEMHQAQLVLFGNDFVIEGAPADENAVITKIKIQVSNFSDASILGINAFLVCDGELANQSRYLHHFGMLLPDQSHEVLSSLDPPLPLLEVSEDGPRARVAAAVEFVDIRGQRWRREGDQPVAQDPIRLLSGDSGAAPA